MKQLSADQIYTPVKSTPAVPRPMAVYVQIPFCSALCSYCHYYKVFKAPQTIVQTYLTSVERELALHEANLGAVEAQSLSFGGGTPSYLSIPQIERLFRNLRQHVRLRDGIEITFEVHPENGSDELFATLRRLGVNRINIGVESLDDDILKNEHHRHTARQAIETYWMASGAGIDNINMDLIYGLTGQTPDRWQRTLEVMAEVRPASICAYYLRLKQGTPEHKRYVTDPGAFPTEHELLLMHVMTFEAMAEAGYSQEIVDWFIRDSAYFHHYQQHNWQRTDEVELLGIGASAYSYVNSTQYSNINDINKYIASLEENCLPIWKGEHLKSRDERMRRSLMLGLKSRVSRKGFFDTYGQDAVEAFAGHFDKLTDLGLVEIDSESVGLTYKGKLFADEVGRTFYSTAMKRRMSAVEPTLISTTFPHLNPS